MTSSAGASLAIIAAFFLVAVATDAAAVGRCYNSIYSFGDSLQDTGNIGVRSNNGYVYYKLPYGETYFRRATGRASDGRLFIDHIADGYGLPFLPAYLAKSGGDFKQGVNFAVVGATATSPDGLRKIGADVGGDDSLSVQVGWAKEVFRRQAKADAGGAEAVSRRTLVVMGEIGGDDYNSLFAANKELAMVETIVPDVINAVINAIVELAEEGLTEFVIPGNLPMGCTPFYIKENPLSKKGIVHNNLTGCVENMNQLAENHNRLLQEGLADLRSRYPHATFTYFDFYESILKLYRDPANYGFMVPPTSACCGGGGSYNINWHMLCGSPGASSCENPSAYISWDGAHLTDVAYGYAAGDLLRLLGATDCTGGT